MVKISENLAEVPALTTGPLSCHRYSIEPGLPGFPGPLQIDSDNALWSQLYDIIREYVTVAFTPICFLRQGRGAAYPGRITPTLRRVQKPV